VKLSKFDLRYKSRGPMKAQFLDEFWTELPPITEEKTSHQHNGPNLETTNLSYFVHQLRIIRVDTTHILSLMGDVLVRLDPGVVDVEVVKADGRPEPREV